MAEDYIKKATEIFLAPLFLIGGIATVLVSNSVFIPLNLVFSLIGFSLGFLGIFYPLIIKKDISSKRDFLIKNKFNNLEKIIIEKLAQAKGKIQKQNYEIEQEVEEISNLINSLSEIKIKTDLEKFLFYSVLFLIISSIFFIETIFFPSLSIKGFLIMKLLGVSFFITGFYNLMRIVLSWRELTNNKMD